MQWNPTTLVKEIDYGLIFSLRYCKITELNRGIGSRFLHCMYKSPQAFEAIVDKVLV
jgi:hypothetical protein